MLKTFFLYINLFLFSLSAFSQKEINHSLQGVVTSVDDEILEFATVLLKHDSVTYDVVYTDSLGVFLFTRVPTNAYKLEVFFLNYESALLDLDLVKDTTVNVVLKQSAVNLDEVIVKATKPAIIRKIDRIVFDPSALINTSGENVYQTLNRAPLVRADDGGAISIRGIPISNVMINGQIVPMSADQLKIQLESIPSEAIENIEVITNPNAKYEAEGLGGLVNIVLKENKKEDGLGGNIGLTYEQTRFAKGIAYLNMNFKKRKFHFFSNFSVKKGLYYQSVNLHNIYNRNLSPYNYFEEGKREQDQHAYFGRCKVNYHIDKKQTIGLQAVYNEQNQSSEHANIGEFQATESLLDSIYYTDIFSARVVRNIAINTNYDLKLDDKGQNFSLNFDYINYEEPELSSEIETQRFGNNGLNIGDPIQFRNTSKQQINIYSGKIDYVKPVLSSMQLSFGSKYTFLQTNNKLSYFAFQNNDFVMAEDQSSLFKYEESNIAFYASFDKKINEKFSFQLGVRNENTFLKGSNNAQAIALNPNYYNFFPSAFFQYNISEYNQLTVNLSQRISRPNYSLLNPFKFFTNPNSYIEGNPFLRAAQITSIDIAYVLRQQFYFNGFAYLTKRQITQVPILDGAENSYRYISVNLDNSYTFGFSAYLPFTIGKWWNTSANITVGLNGVNSEINDAEPYINNNFIFRFVTNNQFVFSRKHAFKGEVNFRYHPPGTTQGWFELGSVLDLSIGIRKSFFKDKLSVSLNVSDIFDKAYIPAIVDQEAQYSKISGSYDRRGIRLSMSYNFGNKIKDSRKERNEVSEESKRLRKDR